MMDKAIKLLGDKNIVANLNMLQKSVRTRIMRKALVNSLAPVKAKAKSRVAKKSGLLQKSIKVKATKNGNAKVFVDPAVWTAKKGNDVRSVRFIGSKREKSRLRSAFTSWAKDNGYEIIKPSKYAHLVEFGTRRAKAKPFLRNSMDESRSEVLGILQKEVVSEFNKEAAKFKTGV